MSLSEQYIDLYNQLDASQRANEVYQAKLTLLQADLDASRAEVARVRELADRWQAILQSGRLHDIRLEHCYRELWDALTVPPPAEAKEGTK